MATTESGQWVPELNDVRDFLVETVHRGNTDDFSVFESAPDNTGRFYFAATTEEGLDFTAMIQVLYISPEEF